MKGFLFVTLLLSSFCFSAQAETKFDGDHFVVAGYDLTTLGRFSDASSTATSGNFDVELEFESGFSIGYEYRELEEDSWGKAFGVSYHFERDADSFKVDGVKTTISSDPASISMLRIYGNAIYRWKTFYLPFGANFTSVTYNKPSGFDGSIDSTGSLGFNFALGWYINEDFCIEYGAHSNLWKLKAKSSAATTDYGQGTLAVATLRLKYKFK